MPTSEVVLRAAVPDDLPAVADLLLVTRRAAVPAMPALVQTDEQVRSFVTGLDLSDPEEREVWVAEDERGLLGYAELRRDWLDDLYVAPAAQRDGIGSALIDLVKGLRPRGFSLWVFATNEGARRFYRRHGLIELETTDGSTNSERAPDIRVAWPGMDPVAFLRRQIDDVDSELGRLLARRVALTAAVQAHKPVAGHEGRDPDREREIAHRMAGHAPALGTERLQRIVHTIITESLDADQGE